MDEQFLRLTNAVYKVLEFFPESDPLKNRAKDRALAIMEAVTLLSNINGWASFQNEKVKLQLSEDIDILLGYLWIAKSQAWLSAVNYLIISNEYEKIQKKFEPYIPDKSLVKHFDGPATISPEASLGGEKIEVKEPEQEIKKPEVDLTDRHKKILEFLDKNKKAQVMDLQKVLPDITKRTIRRDLEDLLRASKIMRMGEFNQVFYKIA